MTEKRKRRSRKRSKAKGLKRLFSRREGWDLKEPESVSWTRRLLWVLMLPWLAVVAFGNGLAGFTSMLVTGISRAWNQRTGRCMLQSLPAVLAAVGVVWLAISVNGAQDNLSNQYQDGALRAFARGDFESSRLYYERLVELDGGQQRTRYELALSLAQLGQLERADTIMQQLAPADDKGYPRAHLWMAERILLEKETFQSADKLQAAYAHLKRAQEAMPDSAQVNLRMSQFLVAVNRYDEAVSFLTHACKYDRKLYYELAMLLGSLNRVDEAKEAFRQARGSYESALRTNAQDQNARLHLASIQMNLDDFQGAVNLLIEGQVLHPEGPFSQAIAHAFVARFDKLQRDGSPDARLQLELLRMALQHDPNSKEVLTRMVDLGESSEESLQETKNILETLLASGYANAFAHFVLGCKSWEAEETDSAIFHFERAYKLDDSLGPVANNLAWILSHDEVIAKDDPKLERALQLIDSVVQQWPNNAAYRDTKGQVLVKLERWDEALDELEFALPTMTENPDLHLALAITYDNLGRKSLATKHQDIAAKLREK